MFLSINLKDFGRNNYYMGVEWYGETIFIGYE